MYLTRVGSRSVSLVSSHRLLPYWDGRYVLLVLTLVRSWHCRRFPNGEPGRPCNTAYGIRQLGVQLFSCVRPTNISLRS